MGLRAIAESLVALAVVLAAFGAIMFWQRWRRGEGLVQSKDSTKLTDLLVHAAPFLCLSLAYNAVLRSRLDATVELTAMVVILAASCGATYRLFKRLEGLQRE